jgi:two-component system phosphate regulon response regulator PhoB
MHTILVADDDEDLLQALDFTLSQNGYNVIQAKDGAETIVEALESKPDLILLDIMMPNLDGFTACRELKNREDTKRIPIIMLTAKGEVEDIKTAFRAGANDYVVKPFIMEQVLEKIEELLVRRAEEKRESNLQETFDNF